MECSKIALLGYMMVVALALGVAKGDIEKDREKCQNQLVALATCLPFVGGEAKSPTTDCCTGLKQVLRDSRECICLLIKDRNDPSLLGLKINATLALQLPDRCKAPVNQSITDCPALLHLPPNSPDAKIFEDFAKGAKNSSSAPAAGSSTTTSSPADEKSDGGEKGRWYWWETQMIKGVFMLVVTITNLSLSLCPRMALQYANGIAIALISLCFLSCSWAWASASADVHELLPLYNLPKDLLPKEIKSYSLSNTDNSFTIELSSHPCYVVFGDQLVYYDKIIKGKLGFGQVTGVSD